MSDFVYSELSRDKLYDTLALIRDVFIEFEAPDYSEEGIAEFLDFLEPLSITGMLDDGEMRIWTCEYEGRIIGAIAAGEKHVNLLFVDGKFHRKGIARRLLEVMIENYKPTEITVNSSPYAVEAYKKLGFVANGSEREENGIRFTPMKRVL
ncbi:MAG: GNAT family N-acetyltransferase [Oscillospiraceae bacterium]|nr:GNAT family N-acetyltransferase [Oscillospiraceae bacterium]